MKAVVSWMLLMLMSFAMLRAGAGEVDGVSLGDAHAIRAVIEAQLQAMAEGDATRAFSYASPSVRMQFGDAPSFMTMVRQGYPMLIRPSSTLFLRPEAVEDAVVQTVHLRGEDGRPWRATYLLQRQKDRSWRINGCMVEPDRGDSVT